MAVRGQLLQSLPLNFLLTEDSAIVEVRIAVEERSLAEVRTLAVAHRRAGPVVAAVGCYFAQRADVDRAADLLQELQLPVV